MKTMRRWVAFVGLAAVLATAAYADPAGAAGGGFNDDYVYASTRSVQRMNANPGWKAALYPVTLAVDTAMLPLAVIAGFVT